MNKNHITSQFTIDFEPVGKRVLSHPGETLSDCALRAGIDLITSCNGLGVCTSCKVEVMEGVVSPPTTNEQARLSKLKHNTNLRLACQTTPLSDVRIFIPAGSLTQGQQLQIDGHYHPTEMNTPYMAKTIEIPPPSLQDLRGDWERLQDTYLTLENIPLQASLPMLKEIPERIRSLNWTVKLVIRDVGLHHELISLLPVDSSYYGIAFDIGSTKIAAFLINLECCGRGHYQSPQPCHAYLRQFKEITGYAGRPNHSISP